MILDIEASITAAFHSQGSMSGMLISLGPCSEGWRAPLQIAPGPGETALEDHSLLKCAKNPQPHVRGF